MKMVGDDMKVGFIGAGKVGFSLGKFFAENSGAVQASSRNAQAAGQNAEALGQHVQAAGRNAEALGQHVQAAGQDSDNEIQVTGYYSRHAESAREAAEFTNSKCYEDVELLVEESDAIFLTVPDGAIKSTYDRIKVFDISNKHICHCSGALSSAEVFNDVRERGACGYSIHPLFPVSDKLNSYQEMPDAFFCLEGEGDGIRFWESYIKTHCRGSKLIDGKSKVKYHAACAIASNLYCALMQESLELLGECGFDRGEALAALSALIESNVKHILEDGPVQALTGPVERGDACTVEKHIKCLDRKTDRELYLAASRKLTEVARAKNPDRDYSGLDRVLDAKDAE
ncbi:MAG: DUF2520 domain-containing protein [Emergencia sp.]